MTYAQKLQMLREQKGLSQKEIADLLQTTQQYYGKYETNQRPLPLAHLITLCQFYAVSSDWVLGLDDEKTEHTA